MTDTQWPRYIVLHQDREGNPHRYAGSVHAPDAEMALLNARDVFVRRPECVSLWVVRADRVFAITAEQLENQPDQFANLNPFGETTEPYYVFQKIGPRSLHSHVGEVEARSPEEAMKLAIERFPNKNITVWWVFPTRGVRQSSEDDIKAMFAIAETKLYRDQGQYHTVAALRRIKDQNERNKDQDRERANNAG
jgi:ring-1,2-phenylacetyl-CoA epoxidase subunit PaaB